MQSVKHRLDGKVAVVTGGARGIGFAIAEPLIDEGAAVAVLAMHADPAKRAVGELTAHGGKVIAIAASSRVRGCGEALLPIRPQRIQNGLNSALHAGLVLSRRGRAACPGTSAPGRRLFIGAQRGVGRSFRLAPWTQRVMPPGASALTCANDWGCRLMRGGGTAAASARPKRCMDQLTRC